MLAECILGGWLSELGRRIGRLVTGGGRVFGAWAATSCGLMLHRILDGRIQILAIVVSLGTV